MCLRPITIKNPSKYKKSYASEYGRTVELPKYLLPKDEYITVPCGKCAECRQSYHNSILQRAIVESLTSYIFFITLTYDNHHIPSIKVEDDTFLYADYDHIQNMFKRFRNLNNIDGREFRYLSVNEYGDRKHRPHFHLLLFVSKLEGDNDTTPHRLQKVIFNTLGDCFAVNKGTRKNPIYERLFTYRLKYKNGKLNTNYFVKYVEPNEFYSTINEEISETYTKTVRYLIGYVNKPSAYEQKIEVMLDKYKETDRFLYNKLKHLLRSQIRYSKGFGCGFVDGKKYYLPKISVRASSDTILYSDLVDSLPSSFEEFKEDYPDMYYSLDEFIKLDIYSRYTTWRECKRRFSSHEYLCHCIYLKYFSKEFTVKYRNFQDVVKPTISYSYDFIHRSYSYSPQKVNTVMPETDGLVYRFLREGVEAGIRQGVPFIAFKIIGEHRFTALCKYYKDRVCTIDDQVRMFNAIGVKSYEEWLEKFNKQRDISSVNRSRGNQLKYYNDEVVEQDDIINTIEGEQTYNYLFT